MWLGHLNFWPCLPSFQLPSTGINDLGRLSTAGFGRHRLCLLISRATVAYQLSLLLQVQKLPAWCSKFCIGNIPKELLARIPRMLSYRLSSCPLSPIQWPAHSPFLTVMRNDSLKLFSTHSKKRDLAIWLKTTSQIQKWKSEQGLSSQWFSN